MDISTLEDKKRAIEARFNELKDLIITGQQNVRGWQDEQNQLSGKYEALNEMIEELTNAPSKPEPEPAADSNKRSGK